MSGLPPINVTNVLPAQSRPMTFPSSSMVASDLLSSNTTMRTVSSEIGFRSECYRRSQIRLPDKIVIGQPAVFVDE